MAKARCVICGRTFYNKGIPEIVLCSTKCADVYLDPATQLSKKLPFDVWYTKNEDKINTELAENGADREMDFNLEHEFDKRYQKYLDE